uniref:Anaphase-promoting complex subunit 11 n=1 Tax=Lotharella globosa TaxID=91324 RepID=A0A7S3YJR9_9EUKA
MGFPTSLVLETGSLHTEFECGICLSLAEYPSHTKCSHVFCKSCLKDWLQQKMNCPKCKTELPSADDVQDLKTASPLAWRILCRVRVRCPLHTQKCTWKGDYGDIQAHLMNSKTHKIDEKSSGAAKRAMAKASAEAFKEQGNQQFRARAYGRAILLYSKALSLAPEMAPVYCNRSAAYLQLERYDDAVADAREAIKLMPTYARGHQRLAQALCEMGEFGAAARHLQSRLEDIPELATDHQKALQLSQGMADGKAAMKDKNYGEARQIFRALSTLTKSEAPVLMALRAELEMGRCDYALSRSLTIIRAKKKCVDAYVVRAWAMYLRRDFDQALKHCREALRLDPDFAEARNLYKKVKIVNSAFESARKSYSQRNFEQAVIFFTEAIEKAHVSTKSPLWASLHAQRAQAYRRLHKLEDCLKDCKVAIQTQDDNKTAWTTRASVLIEMGKPEEAEKEMARLLEGTFQNDTMVRHIKEKAEFERRKRKRPNYYEILGVSSIASEMEIKSAYKKRALELHPDRIAKENDQKKSKEYEEKFKATGEALEILTDTMKRKLYDEGFNPI